LFACGLTCIQYRQGIAFGGEEPLLVVIEHRTGMQCQLDNDDGSKDDRHSAQPSIQSGAELVDIQQPTRTFGHCTALSRGGPVVRLGCYWEGEKPEGY